MYKCKFCGYFSPYLEDFEPDEQLNKGYWCPYCDGFTYYEEDFTQHRFTLLLENPTLNQTIIKKPDFPTQVSPLRYPGGKSKLIGRILMECNFENMENFVEPFAGGASVGLSLLLAGKIKELYLNDLDFGIFSLYQVIKTCPDILIDKINSFIPTKKEYMKAQKYVLSGCDGLDLLDAAWNTLIVNRLAFSGIPKANCLSNPSARWNAKTLSKRIKNISEKAEHIHISCEDACKYIEEMYWRPHTTIFIDPPYYLKGKALYVAYFDDKAHYNLSVLLDSLYKGMPGADMLVTYDFCEFINNLYYYPTIQMVGRKYSIAN